MVLRSHFNRKKKIVEVKKQLVQDLIPPPRINIHMCTLYTRMNSTCRDLVNLDSLGPQVSHPDPWAHIRVPCSVYVCVYTHIHPHRGGKDPIGCESTNAQGQAWHFTVAIRKS